MKKMILLFSVLAVVSSYSQSKVERRIVIEHVNVIPMDTERVLTDQSVIIEGGMVVSIGKNLKAKSTDQLIDGRGKYLIPGLAEMHAHVPPINDLAPMKEVLILFAMNGITTIRGMLGHPKHLELREMINRGEVLGPKLYTTGPSFNGMSVTSPGAGAEMVRKQKEAGYDYLKLHPGLTRAEFDAIARAANEVKIPFVGHVSFGVGVWHAIESGYSSIDHLDGFVEGLVPDLGSLTEQQTGPFGMLVADKADRGRIPKLVSALKDRGIWVVPTQSLAERWFSPDFRTEDFLKDPNSKYMRKETVDQWVNSKNSLLADSAFDAEKARRFIQLRRDLIRACQAGGVNILLGCDAPQVFNVPGFSTHQELKYLVVSGLTPYEALRAGTVNVAQYLGIKNAGTIQVGSPADLVLIGGNPLSDIANTSRIEGVLLDGKWYPPSFIQGELKKLEKNR